MPGWQLGEKLGEGGYGEVWRVVNREDQRQAALKIVRIPHDESERYALFGSGMSREETSAWLDERARESLDEIRSMRELSDVPEVVAIQDYGVLREKEPQRVTIWLRMELLESLDRYLYRRGAQTLGKEETIRMGLQLAAALKACEQYGILHRDIKPSNIFRDEQGNFRLGDFGVARQLEDGRSRTLSRRGTPRYMAPEIAGARYGMAADLYSLGLVLYQQFNHGRLPFEPDWTQKLGAAEVEEAVGRRMAGERIPAPEECDDRVSQVILRALEADPHRRWPSAAAFGAALAETAGPEGNRGQEAEQKKETSSVAPARESDSRDRSESGRRRWGIVLAALGVLAVLAFVGMNRGGSQRQQSAAGVGQSGRTAAGGAKEASAGSGPVVREQWMEVTDHTDSFALVQNRAKSAQMIDVQFRWLDDSGAVLETENKILPCVPAGAIVPVKGWYEGNDVSGTEISLQCSEPLTDDLPLAEVQIRMKETDGGRMTLVVENHAQRATACGIYSLFVLNHSNGRTEIRYSTLPEIGPGESTEVTLESSTGPIDPDQVSWDMRYK